MASRATSAEETVELVLGGRTVDTDNPLPFTPAAGGASSAAAATATTSADQTVDNTSGGVTILAANLNRKALVVEVVSGGNVRVSVGGTPTAGTGIQLILGGEPLVLESTVAFGCPTGAVKAIREGSTNGVVSVTELA